MGREWAIQGNGARPRREHEGRPRRSPQAPEIVTPEPHQDPGLRSLLVPFVRLREAEMNAGIFEMFRGFGNSEAEGQRLLEAAKDSPFLYIVFVKACRELERFDDPQVRAGEKEFRRIVDGQTFEAFATVYRVAQRQEEGEVVLPPDNVHNIYHKHVFPEAEVLHFPMENRVVSRHGQPDMIEVDPDRDMRVVGAVECTLSSRRSKFVNQTNLFDRAQMTGRIFPDDAELTFMVPSYNISERDKSEFNFEQLPFTHDQFQDFMKWFYKKYQAEDGRTLQQMYREAVKKAAKQAREERYGRLGITVDRGTLIPGEAVILNAAI